MKSNKISSYYEILKKMEKKIDLIMNYLENGKPKLGSNNFGDASDRQFLESIV